MTTPDTFVRLLNSIREHLATHPVAAEIASVDVTISHIDGERATVQLSGADLVDLAAGLLGWAAPLTEVTTTAWRPPAGESVHLTLAGRLPDGLALRVYGGVPYTEDVFGADLQPGGRHGVALSVLRTWATGAVAA